MKWSARTRCVWVCVAFALLFSLFSFRLVYLQIVKHHEYAAIASEKHGQRQTIPAQRGAIVAANGQILAHNVPGELVVADASQITRPDEVTPVLAASLGIPAAEIARKLSTGSRYIVLKREVLQPEAVALREKLRELKLLRGIRFEHDFTRVYPNGSMLCHVLGFTDFDRRGIQGIEASMEQYLSGQDGYRFIERDRRGVEIVSYRGLERPARDGYQVQLTIDPRLQYIVENELDQVVQEFRPEKATIILMRPDTGEILAMGNRPHFDLNKRGEAKPEQMKNRAIIDVVEPGSTFKIVTAAAALNEKKVRPETTLFCENGLWSYGGRTLRDHSGYGVMSVHDILVKSSNIGVAKLAIGLGEQKFYQYIRQFGFGDRTGVELPGEVAGILHPPQRWNKLSITRMPMGHEVAVTPLQMTTAMAVIANGGKLVTPRIVKSITGPDGKQIARASDTELRQVISPQVAQQVNAALVEVVSERGTAKQAAVPPFTVAGKTGTAQKVKEGGRGYETGKYVVSFSGYMPAERPAIVGIVIIDDAKVNGISNYGGTVAAPVFARVAAQAASYLDLERYLEPRKAEPVGKVALSSSTKSSRR
jgi:cell division protein FtsI/penicillin-binding protein 2